MTANVATVEQEKLDLNNNIEKQINTRFESYMKQSKLNQEINDDLKEVIVDKK